VSGRSVFVIVAAAVAALVLFTAVVRPAVDRGGFAELAALGIVMLAVLLAERWLRGR
jgi:hypothetical protein